MTDPNSDCVEWGKARFKTGYGKVTMGGGTKYAHRVAYELEHGPIPNGMVVMHSCDNPPCVNPDHLSVGTRADNMRDMAEKGRARSVPRPGESNPFSRLTWEQVEGIRADERPHRAIAADYGVHQTTISRVKRRDTWI